MPITKEQLEADIASLNGAIGAGVRSATVGGQTVTYNTTDSLIRARNDLQAQLDGLLGKPRRPRQTYTYYGGRGYD